MNKAILITLTEKEFEDIITDAIKKALDEYKNIGSNNYMTRKETAKMLHISLPTLYSYTKNGTIPHKKIHGRVLYDKRDIENL